MKPPAVLFQPRHGLWQNARLVVLCALAAGWACAVLFRLYWLQVERYDHYQTKAIEQQQRVVVLDPPRGTIYDARGRQLAVSVEVSSIAAHPPSIEDPESTADLLSQILGSDRDELLKRLTSSRNFVWVQRKVDQPRADAIRELGLPGLDFLPESKRYYPMRSLAAQVLGYVGLDNHGLAGLEYLYDDTVATEKGRRTVLLDGLRGTVMYPNLASSEARPGSDLHLTLDAALQHIVERELEKGVRSSGGTQGTAVMMNPKTGAILAMASYPTFDPNRFNDYPQATWRNAPITDAFEPGSTFKMVTLAAALEAGAVDPLQTFFCGNGHIVLGRTLIRDHSSFGHLTVREVIAKSSNVGAIKLGRSAGKERLYSTIEAFGFGKPTGIDLPSEGAGLFRPLDRWSPITPAYISFGQGISITALQLTNAFAAIANGGRLLKPYVVDSIDKPRTGEPGREVVGLPISPSSVRQIRSMLESVVIDGTAKTASLNGYRAAGKTGTAQKATRGGYAANRYIASFVGFAPVSNPSLVLSVIIDEPWPRYHGGEVAGPIFSAIAQQTLLYLGIPPDQDVPGREWPSPPAFDDGGSTIQLARSEVTRRATPEGTIPDFRGLSAREAVLLSSKSGLQLDLEGHGAVSRQLPEPGTPLETVNGAVSLWLEISQARAVPAAVVPTTVVPTKGLEGAM